MAFVDGEQCPYMVHSIQMKNYLQKKSKLGVKIYIYIFISKPSHPFLGKCVPVTVMLLNVAVVEQ
jgi:hypothetical protein